MVQQQLTQLTAFIPNSIAKNLRSIPQSDEGSSSFLLPNNVSIKPLNAIHESCSTADLIATSITTTTTIAAVETQQSQQSFEPIAPDTSTLIGFGFVVILSIVASFVWANEVVPVSRTKLALSKRDGDVKKYLDELKEGGNYKTGRSDIALVDNEFSVTEGNESSTEGGGDAANNVAAASKNDSQPNDGRDFERWLFTDWLENNKSAGKPGRKKEPALPILKNAKWNSGDNPVLVTFALMMVGVIIASVTERAGSGF